MLCSEPIRKALWEFGSDLETTCDPIGHHSKVLEVTIPACAFSSQLKLPVDRFNPGTGCPVCVVGEDFLPMLLERFRDFFERS